MRCKLLLVFMLVSVLNACVSTPQTAALGRQSDPALLKPILLNQLPFFSQSAYQCGPAALATLLVHSQVHVTPEELVPLVYVPARQGSFQIEMVAATRSFGRLAYPLNPNLKTVFDEVRAGHPVLVLQNLGLSWYPRWHFAVVKGFDLSRERIFLNSGTIENYEMSLATFERTWARAQYWGMLALEPGALPATAEAMPYYMALAELEETHPEAEITSGYRSGLQAWPSDQNLLMGYGNLLYAKGNSIEAAQQFEKVILHHHTYAPAWNNLAQILWERGEVDQARRHVLEAIELGGPFVETYRATLRKINATK